MSAAVSLATRALPPSAKLAKMKAELLRKLRRKGGDEGAFRCTHCGGRIEVFLHRDRYLAETGSRGECRTPGCIIWED